MNPIHDCFAKALPASAMILAAGLCIGTAFAQEPGKSITIDPNKTTITTSPLLYGIFSDGGKDQTEIQHSGRRHAQQHVIHHHGGFLQISFLVTGAHG